MRSTKKRETNFQLGDKVIKNEATWIPNEFDSWGRGEGVGEVVKPPHTLDKDEVDVKWPTGRCFETVSQLKKYLES